MALDQAAPANLLSICGVGPLVAAKILGEIRDVETIATGHAIHVYGRLVQQFGRGNWRKMKGIAIVRLSSADWSTSSYTGMRLTESGSAV